MSNDKDQIDEAIALGDDEALIDVAMAIEPEEYPESLDEEIKD